MIITSLFFLITVLSQATISAKSERKRERFKGWSLITENIVGKEQRY